MISFQNEELWLCREFGKLESWKHILEKYGHGFSFIACCRNSTCNNRLEGKSAKSPDTLVKSRCSHFRSFTFWSLACCTFAFHNYFQSQSRNNTSLNPSWYNHTAEVCAITYIWLSAWCSNIKFEEEREYWFHLLVCCQSVHHMVYSPKSHLKTSHTHCCLSANYI